MKKLAITFGVALASFFSIAQEEVKTGGAQISFDKEIHDYGTIDQGGNGECAFTFTNTGNEPLIITKAKGSCGCTVPDWPKEPIAPGAKGTIKVKYDTNRVGPINKTVTVESNASNAENGVKTIRIKGNVKAPEDLTPKKEPVGPIVE
jgi:hypothetical protein